MISDEVTIADYEEVLDDHRRLVRELDVILNGEDGAAKQASLCDIVAQISTIRADEQKIWIILDSKGECVMMRPTEPSEEDLFAVATRIKKTCTYRAFYLRPAP